MGKVWAILTNHASIKVLHTAFFGNVTRDTEVEEDVVKAGVLVWLQAAQDNKAAAIMDSLGGMDEPAAQIRERERAWVDIVRAEVRKTFGLC